LFLFCCSSSFFLLSFVDLPDLHSFPTRRSSDLNPRLHDGLRRNLDRFAGRRIAAHARLALLHHQLDHTRQDELAGALQFLFGERSEEHTSELQSQSNLVCRLLLEKKKKKKRQLRLVQPPNSIRYAEHNVLSPYPNPLSERAPFEDPRVSLNDPAEHGVYDAFFTHP